MVRMTTAATPPPRPRAVIDAPADTLPGLSIVLRDFGPGVAPTTPSASSSAFSAGATPAPSASFENA